MRLIGEKYDFSASYMAVQYLYKHISSDPDSVTAQTIKALLTLLESDRFESESQSLFLYREASESLVKVPVLSDTPVARKVIPFLQTLLINKKGRKKRAIAQALGTLPLRLKGPVFPVSGDADFLEINFKTVLEKLGITNINQLTWQGRSLVGENNSGDLGILKFARSEDDIPQLIAEYKWMEFLAQHPPCPFSRFDVPVPLAIGEKSLFKFLDLPESIEKDAPGYRNIVIAYQAHKEYFTYPNSPGADIPDETLAEIFKRNAWLLGRLTSMGVIHTALIPLFHNRVQQDRRSDAGLYHWEQGGRLDKWLDSCEYPNFAVSGIRDFEHLIPIKNTKRLHHYIGTHILSFILVIGSYFRNKHPEKKGVDKNGNPIDTRHLFDEDLFATILRDIIEDYYQGMTGSKLGDVDSILYPSFVKELIDKMGFDEHMDEMFRMSDQDRMNDKGFADFLESRGYLPEQIDNMERGASDIALHTGPHLGGFNQRISVPELTEFLFSLSSRCISDRFLMENALNTCYN